MNKINEKSIRRLVVLSGTRRVGKTTIQYQTIDSLLKSGVSPNKIVFISMDHPMLKLSQFQDVLECYHESIYPNQDVYYFFDEIQYAQDWNKWLKTIFVCAMHKQACLRFRHSKLTSNAKRWLVFRRKLY